MTVAKMYETFCGNIRYLRARDRLTQKEMAALLGISVGTLRKLESGMPTPRLRFDILLRTEDVFGVSPDTLLNKPMRKTK